MSNLSTMLSKQDNRQQSGVKNQQAQRGQNNQNNQRRNEQRKADTPQEAPTQPDIGMLTLDSFEEASEIVKNVTSETKLIFSNYLSAQTETRSI